MMCDKKPMVIEGNVFNLALTLMSKKARLKIDIKKAQEIGLTSCCCLMLLTEENERCLASSILNFKHAAWDESFWMLHCLLEFMACCCWVIKVVKSKGTRSDSLVCTCCWLALWLCWRWVCCIGDEEHGVDCLWYFSWHDVPAANWCRHACCWWPAYVLACCKWIRCMRTEGREVDYLWDVSCSVVVAACSQWLGDCHMCASRAW